MSRLRGFLWLAAGLVVAFLAAVVAYTTIQRAASLATGQVRVQGEMRRVVVVAQPVPVRAVLTAEMLTTQDLPVASVPEGAATEIDKVVGLMTLTELYVGEVVLLPRLVDPNIVSGDGRVAVALVPEQVLMAVPADDLMSRVAVLKPGDKVDILVSMSVPGGGEQDEKLVTYALLQMVTIAALPGAQQPEEEEAAQKAANQPPVRPQALLVTLAPQDALILKYALDAGGIKDIVLRAPGADQEWDVEPVDIDFLINAYKIPVE